MPLAEEAAKIAARPRSVIDFGMRKPITISLFVILSVIAMANGFGVLALMDSVKVSHDFDVIVALSFCLSLVALALLALC